MTRTTSPSVGATTVMVRALHVHADRARERLLDAAAKLDPSALDQPFEMGPGSLRRTLRHLWAAERFWLGVWRGEDDPRAAAKGAPPAPSVDELRGLFDETARGRDTLLGNAGDLAAQVVTPPGRAPSRLLDLVLHVVNHGFHHRAQAINMVRRLAQAGAKPLWLDFLAMRVDGTLPATDAHDAATIALWFRSGDWARTQVHAAAALLPEPALARPFEMGLGTLHRTLLHALDAERWWLENWAARPPECFGRLPETTPLAALPALWADVERRRGEILGTATVASLRRAVVATPAPGRRFELSIGDSMIQLCGHGTHHRAQAINMLRALGAAPPATCLLDFLQRPEPRPRA
jgi:uncharacterized damage-inducible protein DinB